MTTSALYRVFKTTRFGKDAKKAGIGDAELCDAIAQVMAGQADDLGGGVFKQLAKAYAGVADEQLAVLLKDKDLLEICNGKS